MSRTARDLTSLLLFLVWSCACSGSAGAPDSAADLGPTEDLQRQDAPADLPDAAPPDGPPPPPVTSTVEQGAILLDNALVFARARLDGGLEIGRAGQQPFVMDRDPVDSRIVCLKLPGSTVCAGAASGVEEAASVSQEVVDEVGATCVRTVFSGLKAGGVASAVELTWLICLAPGSDEVVCRLSATGESAAAALERLYFPYAPRLSSRGRGYAVIPFRHGALLPVGWLHTYTYWVHHSGGKGATFGVEFDALGTSWTMPWVGVVEEDGRGLYVGVRTEADARLSVRQPLGGAPRVTVAHRASLGTFAGGGPREVVYVPLAAADHAVMAKRYREHAISAGRHVSLAAKQAARPAVAKLIGGAEINVATYNHDARKTPPATYIGMTFAEAAAALQAARTAAVEPIARGLLHVDGWGQRGYDNLHPDIVLPAAECAPSPGGSSDCGPVAAVGGWAGLAQLVQAASSGDFVVGLHDNYRDFYLDAPSYGADALALHDADGALPAPFAAWAGGPQQILCASAALPFLQRTLGLLDQRGALPGAYYLDVFSAVPPDECGAPAHRMTRAQSLAHRAALLQELSKRGIVVSSEEAADWAVPYIDHVFWSGYLRSANGYHGSGTPVGVPAPLVDLVYHDALVVPWGLLHGDRGERPLDAWLSAGIAEVDLSRLTSERIRREVNLQAALHLALGTKEMTTHRFLDDRYMSQEAGWAGGAVTAADRDALTVTATGVSGVPAGTRTRSLRYRVWARIKSWTYVPPASLQLTLEWTADEPLSGLPDHRVLLHAVDVADPAKRVIVANGDHQPQTPTGAWPVSAPVQDAVATLTFSAGGTFELVTGLFVPGAGRLPLEATVTGREEIVLGRVTVQPGASISVDDRPRGEATLVLARVAGADSVEVMTEWLVGQPMPPGLKVFFHALDGGGAIAANADYFPAVPVDKWLAGARRRERRRSVKLAPGSYKLVTGMFDPSTGARVDFQGAQSDRTIDLGSLTVEGKTGAITAIRYCPPSVAPCP